MSRQKCDGWILRGSGSPLLEQEATRDALGLLLRARAIAAFQSLSALTRRLSCWRDAVTVLGLRRMSLTVLASTRIATGVVPLSQISLHVASADGVVVTVENWRAETLLLRHCCTLSRVVPIAASQPAPRQVLHLLEQSLRGLRQRNFLLKL